MTNFDVLGINSYHESLPRGQRDAFVREVADAIGKTTSSVYYKLRTGKWNMKTEYPVVIGIIQSK